MHDERVSAKQCRRDRPGGPPSLSASPPAATGALSKITVKQPKNRKIMKKTVLFTAVVLIAAATCVRAGDVKENYEKSCVKCHGADGKGDTKMGKKVEVKDLTDAKFQGSFTDDQAFKSIKEGIKDGEKTKMKPAEGLSDDEIKALVAHVRTLKK
jgi:cytochrome c553